jgi:heme/copper-type cytochrome/quinol oxidase subunit 2
LVTSCEQTANVLEDAYGTAARLSRIIVDNFAFMLVITLFAAACLFIF